MADNPNLKKQNAAPWDHEANYMLNVGGRTVTPPGFRPVISWLIPTWNTREDWLLESVESALHQCTPHPFEVVVVDDGSDVPVKFRNRDARVRLLRQEHQGLTKALNFGLMQCKGDIVLRLDADDIAAPWRIAKSAAIGDADLLGGAMSCILSKGVVTASMPAPRWTDAKTHLQLLQTLCWHPTWAFRRDAVLGVGGYPLGYECAEDFALLCKLVKAGKKVININDMLTYYRRHAGQVHNIHGDEMRASTERAFREIMVEEEKCDTDGSATSVPGIDMKPNTSDAGTPSPPTESTSKAIGSTETAVATPAATSLGSSSACSVPSALPKKPKRTPKAPSDS